VRQILHARHFCPESVISPVTGLGSRSVPDLTQSAMLTREKQLVDECLSLGRSLTARVQGILTSFTTQSGKRVTLKERLDPYISKLLCWCYCHASQHAIYNGDLSRGEQLFFEASGVCNHLAIRYSDCGAMLDVTHVGVTYMRIKSEAAIGFGRSLHKMLSRLTRELRPCVKPYWSAWTSVVAAQIQNMSGDDDAALEHTRTAWDLASRLKKKRSWKEDSGVAILGIETGTPGSVEPLTNLLFFICDIQSSAFGKKVLNASVDAKSAGAEDFEERRDLLIADCGSWVDATQLTLLFASSHPIQLLAKIQVELDFRRQLLSCLRSVKSEFELQAIQYSSSDVELVRNVMQSFPQSKCAACGATQDASARFSYCPCKTVKYCSKPCQKTHWKATHKKDCTARLAARGQLTL